MIKRFLLTAKKEDKTNYETFFTMRSAEYRQLEFIHCGYKTKIIPRAVSRRKRKSALQYLQFQGWRS